MGMWIEIRRSGREQPRRFVGKHLRPDPTTGDPGVVGPRSWHFSKYQARALPSEHLAKSTNKYPTYFRQKDQQRPQTLKLCHILDRPPHQRTTSIVIRRYH